MRTRFGQLLIISALAFAALGGVNLAHAGTPVLVSPLANGTVDFGDRVLFRVAGSGCELDSVRVKVTGGPTNTDVLGSASTPAQDPLSPGTCVGYVSVPSESAVRSGSGWEPGDQITIAVVSNSSAVALLYQRVEVDLGTPAGGAPVVVTPSVADPRTGSRDKAVQMNAGDVISLGRVDLTKIYSVSLRVCIPSAKPHFPTEFALRASTPTGPSIVGPVDISDGLLNSWKALYGWPNCWQLQPWPITGQVPGRAPMLYLAMITAPSPVLISSIDFNGTGAKVVDVPAQDPPGTQQIFDGSSFAGWTQSGCALEDHGVRTTHSSDTDMGGCTMTYSTRKLHNVMVRLEYRQQDFGANGGVYLSNEIQMREPGEWLTGGFLGDNISPALTTWVVDNSGGGYPAQRIKTNSYPEWSQMEVVQLGARFIVRINGRTVTDHVASDPAAYNLRVVSQPIFSYGYGVAGRFDTTTWNPTVTTPASWGNIWFKNIRVYDCLSLLDPVCANGQSVAG